LLPQPVDVVEQQRVWLRAPLPDPQLRGGAVEAVSADLGAGADEPKSRRAAEPDARGVAAWVREATALGREYRAVEAPGASGELRYVLLPVAADPTDAHDAVDRVAP